MSFHHNIKHITAVSVGTPPNGYSYEGWKTTEVHFHGFAGLPSACGEIVVSPEFTCCGHQWRLELCPGGDDKSPREMIAVYLKLCSSGKIFVEYSLVVEDTAYYDWEALFSYGEDYGYYDYDGTPDFAKRSKIMNALVKGTLIIEVRMKLDKEIEPFTPFIPENPLCKHILKRFMEEETADVLFEVGSESEGCRGARKRIKGTLATFHAHSFVLRDCAPTLAELCKSATTMSPIRISDVKPDMFRHMLYYVYGGKISDEVLESNARDLIDVADKYSVVNLKLEAEACYARSVKLTVGNMLDILLYADSKNCALLKELVIDFMVENWEGIIGKVSFQDVPGSITTDLLTAMGRGEGKDKESSKRTDCNVMRVGTLRKKLHEKGLDIDGSREAMIALLKENL